MHITRSLLFIFLIFPFVQFNAQNTCPTWNWVDSIAPIDNDDYRLQMKSDSAGNLYVVGSFTSLNQLIFGPDTLTTTYPLRSFFIAKRDTNRVWVWGEQFELHSAQCGYVEPQDFALDKSGILTLTGSYCGQAAFGPHILSDSINTYKNLFVARFDVNTRQWLWAQKASSVNQIEGRGIAVDDTGNSYITGYANSIDTNQIAFFDNLSLEYDSAISFISKITSSGDWQWVKTVAKTSNFGNLNSNYKIVVDPNGHPILTGRFIDQITVNGITVYDTGALGTLYVIKYHPNGTPIWLQTIENIGPRAIDLNSDASGNIYLTGEFYLNITFGSTILNTPWPKKGRYLAKLNTNGQWLWAMKVADGNLWESAFIVTPSSIFLTGIYYGDLVCGNDTVTGRYSHNLYLVEIDSSGNHVWHGSAGGGSSTQGLIASDISADKNGNLYIIGYSKFKSYYGLHSLLNPSRFIAKIRPDSILNIGLPNDTLLYCGESLKITPTTSNVANLKVRWSPSHGLDDSTALEPVAAPDSTTTYTLFASTLGGCSTTEQITIQKDSTASYMGAIDVFSSLGHNNYCNDTGLTLFTPLSYPHYLWSTGDTTATLNVTKPGTYSLTVIDSNGCYISGSVNLSPLVTISPSSSLLCANDSVSLSASASGIDSLRWSTGNIQAQFYIHQPGWYWVTGYKGGCSYTDSVKIDSFNDTANARFNYASNGLNVSFIPQSIGISQGFWDFGDGSTSNAISPQHTYGNAGSYSVCFTATDVCGYTATHCDSVSVNLLSQKEHTIRQSLEIYPNPARDKIYIKTTSPHYGTLEIMDMRGRLLLFDRVPMTTEHEISISYLPPGCYFIKVGSAILPFVKM